MSIQYTCNISKYHEVYANLSETSDLFYQSLTERVDIEKYSRKLVAKAQRVEAWVNNKLVGLLAYYKNEDENVLYISNVSVLKEYQGQGIASYLIEKLKNNREKKYEKIKLMVFSEDKTAIDFYKKNGFYLDKKVGEQNEMYFRFETIVPVVSVCCVTYNHASYIRQCLDGFIMQKTTFPIEILIHEDASTDGTADIIREYESKYPEIIKPIYQTENQYSKGVAISATYNWPRVQGKYIAMCEGDDYWTDPYKLQKQVDFLEANPKYVLVSHNYTRLFANDGHCETNDYSAFLTSEYGFSYDYAFALFNWVTQPLTTVYKKSALSNVNISRYKYFRDTHLYYLILQNGLGYCMNINAGVYRLHEGGIDSVIIGYERCLLEYNIDKDLYKNNRHDEVLKQKYKSQYQSCFNQMCQNHQKWSKQLWVFLFDSVRYHLGIKHLIKNIIQVIKPITY